MDVQSLNYFSMAQRFLELKMDMAMSMTGNGLGRGHGQQGDTDFLPGRRHMLSEKYLVCSFPLLPFLLPESSRWRTHNNFVSFQFSSPNWLLFRDVSCLWNTMFVPSSFRKPSLFSPTRPAKSFTDVSPRKSPSSSTKVQDSQLQPSPFSSWNNSTQISSVSFSFLWLQ